MSELRIRPEAPGDAVAVRRLNDAAFGQPDEGEIVDRLREALAKGDRGPWISLVAEIDGGDGSRGDGAGGGCAAGDGDASGRGGGGGGEGDGDTKGQVDGDDLVVGHILFTEVKIRDDAGEPVGVALGLAPMAVRPDSQGRGIGSRLVEAGLAACAAAGHDLVVVLGHPTYYPRFGFVEAATLGLTWEHDAPSEAFMALELTPGAAARRRGIVGYRPEFG